LEDREEVLAMCGMDPRVVLPQYIVEGREVYVAGTVHNGSPEIIYGVDPILDVPDAAVVWLLSTPVLYDYPVEFTVRSKQIWDEIHSRFELLTNFTDARNTRHHGWLKWLGCHPIRRVEKFGAQSLPFIEFASFRP
jgi:hypothetical protein